MEPKPENQVTCQELSKQLKENGYPQKGLWWWIWNTHFKHSEGLRLFKNTMSYRTTGKIKDGGIIEYFAAPTCTELGQALLKLRNEFSQGWNDSGCYWYFRAGDRGSGSMIEGIGKSFSADDTDNEANARAKLWLFLKKKGATP